MKDFQNFIQKKLKNNILAVIALVLASVFFILFIVYTLLDYQLQSDQLLPAPITLAEPAEYPMNQNTSLTISADAALVMDDTSKVVIYAKNPTLRFSPASTTKMMTALTAISYFKPDDIITVKQATSEGVIIGLESGQQLYFKDLLYALLLPSANDAAIAIADNFPGGESAFVKKMNENAERWKLFNTHFGDPAGLLDDDNYTTVTELARIASMVKDNDILSPIVNTGYATITTIDNKKTFQLKTTNKLLGLYGIDGVKTGHTEGAKDVLATSIEHDGNRFISVVMRSDDRFADTVNLIKSIVDTTTFLAIHP